MSKPLRVLQVGKFYPIRGGVEKVMYDLTVGLSRREIHCDMLCASTENYTGGDVVLNTFGRVIVVPTQIKLAATMLAPQMIFKLRKIAKSYDIIHIHHPDPMACLSLFLSGFSGQVILHWHSDIVKQKKLLMLYKPLQDWLIRRANIIIGTSPVYVQESPFLKKVQHKTTYVPIGIEALNPDKKISNALRKKYGDKKIVFALGRLVEYKGYTHLIKAMSLLDDSYQLIIGGKGPLKEDLTKLISDLNVEHRVELINYISDEEVASYYNISTLFCLSSTQKTEAFAIVQIEAMSLGKPVVCAHIDGSGVSWVNAHDKSGMVVEKENANALAGAIRMITNDQSNFDRLSRGAKDRFNSLFTEEAMIKNTLEIYKKLRRRAE